MKKEKQRAAGTAPFELGEWAEVAREFRRIFHADFQRFYDKTLSLLIFRQWKIDIFFFEDWLTRKHRPLREGEESIRDVVREYYGAEGERLIQRLL